MTEYDTSAWHALSILSAFAAMVSRTLGLCLLFQNVLRLLESPRISQTPLMSFCFTNMFFRFEGLIADKMQSISCRLERLIEVQYIEQNILPFASCACSFKLHLLLFADSMILNTYVQKKKIENLQKDSSGTEAMVFMLLSSTTRPVRMKTANKVNKEIERNKERKSEERTGVPKNRCFEKAPFLPWGLGCLGSCRTKVAIKIGTNDWSPGGGWKAENFEPLRREIVEWQI